MKREINKIQLCFKNNSSAKRFHHHKIGDTCNKPDEDLLSLCLWPKLSKCAADKGTWDAFAGLQSLHHGLAAKKVEEMLLFLRNIFSLYQSYCRLPFSKPYQCGIQYWLQRTSHGENSMFHRNSEEELFTTAFIFRFKSRKRTRYTLQKKKKKKGGEVGVGNVSEGLQRFFRPTTLIKNISSKPLSILS